jgi:hypothetical protein
MEKSGAFFENFFGFKNCYICCETDHKSAKYNFLFLLTLWKFSIFKNQECVYFCWQEQPMRNAFKSKKDALWLLDLKIFDNKKIIVCTRRPKKFGSLRKNLLGPSLCEKIPFGVLSGIFHPICLDFLISLFARHIKVY